MASPAPITDYLCMQDLLTDEEKLVREQASQFVAAEVIPIIEKHAQEQRFPRHLVRPMGELGFYGPTLPQKYGCAGLSSVAYGLLMYELERGDSAIRSFASVSVNVGSVACARSTKRRIASALALNSALIIRLSGAGMPLIAAPNPVWPMTRGTHAGAHPETLCRCHTQHTSGPDVAEAQRTRKRRCLPSEDSSRIATSGWFTMGLNPVPPIPPRFVIVKVPPSISSGFRRYRSS